MIVSVQGEVSKTITFALKMLKSGSLLPFQSGPSVTGSQMRPSPPI
jgi:hypothetical protein